MGKPTGFREYNRELPPKRPISERLRDYREINRDFPVDRVVKQAARCMDCGVPFCHTGCPLGNIIPDFNHLVYRDQWKRALDVLHSTNNFPEFTGRICPAPCEEACVLGITDPPVTIEQIEFQIVDRGFREGWIRPEFPATRTGKKVAIIGSGPAGLAAAQQLNRAGHWVTVFERADRIGGLLRYGIPDFKLEKFVIDRRIDLMAEEGIEFKTRAAVGTDISAQDLLKEFDAIILAGGATKGRDLNAPGRHLDGIHMAMEYLPQQNKVVAGEDLPTLGIHQIHAGGKHVIVIGGGDTGSDCVGTANRQGARSVTQFEIMPKPPTGRPDSQPWPYWPMKLRSSTSHEEGCNRCWSLTTKQFIGANGHIEHLETAEVEMVAAPGGGIQFQEISGTEKEWKADLVLLALGFVGPETDGPIAQLGVELDGRGNVKTGSNYMTSVPGVFAAGDMRRGQSLVVWAISEGREAARGVDEYLMGSSSLPTKGPGDLPRV